MFDKIGFCCTLGLVARATKHLSEEDQMAVTTKEIAEMVGVSRQAVSAVLYNLSEVGIDVFIVLSIVFMIGRGHKQGVKVNGLDTEIL